MTTRGRFIVVEGIDGSGKSTLINALSAWLRGSNLLPPGAEVVRTRAPGGTPMGREIRTMLLHSGGVDELCLAAELLLYAADIAQLRAQVIRPALAAGHWVLCDRFTGSTQAYQGGGRGWKYWTLASILSVAEGAVVPDLTLFLNLPVKESIRRRAGGVDDRLEATGEAFLRRVAQEYDRLAVLYGWHQIDASQSPEAVLQACQAAITEWLEARA